MSIEQWTQAAEEQAAGDGKDAAGAASTEADAETPASVATTDAGATAAASTSGSEESPVS